MTHPLRIGLLTPGWPGTRTANGIATSVRHLAAGLQAVGAVPVVIGPGDGPPLPEIAYVEKPAVHWSIANKLRAKLGNVAALKNRLEIGTIIEAIRTAHQRHGIDLVIMEETKGWPLDVIPAVPVPVIINLHGPWARLSKALDRPLRPEDHKRIALESQAFGLAAGLMAPSQSSISVTQGLAPDIPRKVIANAFPGGESPAASARLPGHILFVGRVERLKGADTVLRAFALLANQHPEARLTFVGPEYGLRLEDGRVVGMEEAIEVLAPDARERITYMGKQDAETIRQLRATHPIALIGSRYENLNYSLLEAMAAGQAIIATKVGGPAEVLEHEETALLVPPEAPEPMAEALLRLLEAPDRATQLGQTAHDVLTQRFHPETLAQQTVEFCAEVLEHRRQRRGSAA